MDREVRVSVNGKEFNRPVTIEELERILYSTGVDKNLVRARFSDEGDWYPAQDFLQVYESQKIHAEQFIRPTEQAKDISTINIVIPTPPPFKQVNENPIASLPVSETKKKEGVPVFIKVLCVSFGIGIICLVAFSLLKKGANMEDKNVFLSPVYNDIKKYENDKNYEQMLIGSKLLVSSYPRSSAAKRALADAYYYLGDYTKSFQISQEALKLDPQNPRCWDNKAIVSKKLGSNELSIQCYRKALELDLYDPKVNIDYAFVISKTNEPLATGYLNRAQERLNDPKYSNAEVSFPSMIDSMVSLYISMNRDSNALSICNEYIPKGDDYARLYLRKAVVAEKRGDYCEMDIDLNHYPKTTMDNLERAELLKAYSYRKRKSFADALECYKKIYNLNSNSISAIKGIALSLYGLGKNLENLKQIDECIDSIATHGQAMADDFANILFESTGVNYNKLFDSCLKGITDAKTISDIETLRVIGNRFTQNVRRYQIRQQLELDDVEASVLLEAHHIEQDPDLTKTFAAIAQMRNSFIKYKKSVDLEHKKVIYELKSLNINQTYKDSFISAIQKNCIDQNSDNARIISYEGLMIDEIEKSFDVLRQSRPYWYVQNGTINFKDNSVSAYNFHINQLNSYRKLLSQLESSTK